MLTWLSVLTIVAWAWVGTAFLRWFASQIEGAGVRFEFVGTGWGLFWRLFPVYFVAISVTQMIALDAPYPWWTFEIMWFVVGAVELILIVRWLITNTVMVKSTGSPRAAPAVEAPTPRATMPPPKNPTPPPADPPPDVPFPLVVECKYG